MNERSGELVPNNLLKQMSNKISLASAFLQFVDASPSPFHAVFTASKRLIKDAGFVELDEGSSWANSIKPNGK